MREFWIIFKHAYVTKCKSKSFIISTIVMIAAIFLLVNLQSITERFSNDGEKNDIENHLIVLDKSDLLFPLLKEELKKISPELKIVLSDKPEKMLKKEVEEGTIHAYVSIQFIDHQIKAYYTTNRLMDFDLPTQLQTTLEAIQLRLSIQSLSLQTEQVEQLFQPIVFEQQNISTSSKSPEEVAQTSVLLYVFIFVIYFSVIIYASMVAMDVATEKSSRVMEILISSVSPTKHMFAKVFGIGLLGITQMLLYAITGFFAIKWSSDQKQVDSFINFSQIPVSTFIYGLVFFILGYFLYAMLAAFLGSLVSRAEDVQQMITPMSLLLVAAFIIAIIGLNDPEKSFILFASYIPFFSPLVMFLRVGMLDLPLWEPLLAIFILLLTIILLGWFGARVYRGSVLMYGPSRSLKDIRKAIRLGKE